METAAPSSEILYFPILEHTIRNNFSKPSYYSIAALIALMRHSAITIIFRAVIVLDCYPSTARIKRSKS